MKMIRQYRCFLPWLLVLLAVLPLPCPAADVPDDAAPPTENRFLFIIETSSAMKSRADKAREAVLNLIRSAMDGQMRDGDTFGIWTFNDKLDTQFQMQVWKGSKKAAIFQNVSVFLQQCRFEKKAHFELVQPAMATVIQDSRLVNLVLVWDGTGLINGTLFDKDINELHAKFVKSLRSADVPFVTILSAHDGAVFDYTVNFFGGTISVPRTADLVKRPEVKPPPVAANTPPPPPPPKMAAPLIFRSPPPIAKTEPPAPTNATASSMSAASSVPIPKPPSNPHGARIETAAQSVPVPQPAAAIVPAVESRPVQQPPPPKPAAEAAPAPVANPAGEPAVTPAPPAPVVQAAPTETAKATSAVASIKATPTTPAPVPTAPGALAAAVTDSGRARLLLMIACGLLLAAAGVIVFLLRRLRTPDQGSLISQSMNYQRRDG